ncbi:hypothetical protein [Maribacter sp. 2304DJ31-5]|uniref:hypothetical protein n=1 Tax=Maribacter sp. 2304DJ31-5 TaxID=3386273 RepID=UPI0039BCDE56
MKVCILLLLLGGFLTEIDLAEVRQKYKQAYHSPEITHDLNTMLLEVSATDKPVLIGYKGALLTLKAKHAKGIKNKKAFFKKGITFLELAITKEPSNIEIRFLRLSVQENAPKIVGYKGNLKEDKFFIHNNYEKTKNSAVKSLITDYVASSTLFTTAEKQLY